MDPLSLSFRRRDTEREYVHWEIERGQRKVDFEFLCIAAVLCSVASVQCVVAPVSWHHAPALAFGAGQFAWAAIVWRRLGKEELATRRTAMVFRARILLSIVTLVVDIGESPIPVTGLLDACLCDTILDSILVAWGLRLRFQHHFPYQVASTLARMFTTTKRQCAKLMVTSGAASAWSVANGLDYWAKSVMEARYGGCKNEPLSCPCLHVLVWLHVFGVLILQNYLLWRVEWRSRRMFIRTLPEQRRRDEGLVVGFEDTLWIKLMLAVLFMVESAVVWELSYFFVGAINSWAL